MALSTKSLHSIQSAGSALHEAQQLLAEEIGHQARQVSEAMAADPFNIAPDHQFETWKTVARMARSLATMENQIKHIYFAAVELHDGNQLAQPLALGLDPAPAVHVIDAEPSGPTPTRAAKKKANAGARSGEAKNTSRPLKGNAASALAFLKTRLNGAGYERLTHAELASGASIALGSVGFAIATLKSRGLLQEGEKGLYRLLNV